MWPGYSANLDSGHILIYRVCSLGAKLIVGKTSQTTITQQLYIHNVLLIQA